MSTFTSTGQTEEKKTITWIKLSENAYAYTADGDPNTGVIIGDDAVLVFDTTATPHTASALIAKIREVTDKPIKYVVLSHYHAVRVLGASAYASEGLEQIIASHETRALIEERGEQDMESEIRRFPNLFQGVESIPGLTWPTLTFEGEISLWLGSLEVRVCHPGRGHTKGDTIVYLPEQGICFSGDLLESGAACYTGDAYLSDWPQTLDRLHAMDFKHIVPGRGPVLKGPKAIADAVHFTRDFVSTLYMAAQEAVGLGLDLKGTMRHVRTHMDPKFAHVYIYEHCLPFDVSRAFDEASGIRDPQIWTAERDQQMWHALQE